MSVKQIPNLPAAVFISPAAQLEICQDGVTMRASALQIADLNANLNIKLINDIVDGNLCFPLYARINTGETNTLYASDPHYQYIPAEGRLSALRQEAKQGIFLNSNAITQNYIIPTGDNAMSAGPVTVSATITVNAGSNWTII
jgi:hypothetical protein